jgi:hypothetical protein
MEDKESLKASAVVGKTANFVHDSVDLFFAYGVVTTGICTGKMCLYDHGCGKNLTVVGGIFLPCDQRLWVE